MLNILVVVDMQNDFINGSLGSKEAEAIVPAVIETIKEAEGPVFATMDTHFENYLNTAEGKKLPVEHCVKGSKGWEIHPEVREALEKKGCKYVEKYTFGSVSLPALIQEEAGGREFALTLVGLCTDICVVSNALLLKAYFPGTPIRVIEKACAGVSVESHKAALTTMGCCQIDVV